MPAFAYGPVRTARGDGHGNPAGTDGGGTIDAFGPATTQVCTGVAG